jgi:hypothetical protein
MKTGWTNEPPDTEGPAALPVTSMLLGNRERGPGDTLAIAAARSAAADARQAREEAAAVRDPDDFASTLVNRGYSPGTTAGLSQRYADTIAELQAEREKIERSRRRQERIRRDHAAGRITAFDIARMQDFDEGDEGQVARLERRAASLERQLADAAAMIGPRQQPADPLEAASRHAHDVFVQATRAKMAGRPAPRPFGSISRGAAVRGEQPPCEACAAVGASADESFWIHHMDADGRPVSAEAELASGQEAGRSGTYGREMTRVADADGMGQLGNQSGDVIAL